MKSIVQRHSSNPIITPNMVKPTQSDFKVDGVFNAGVTRFNDEIILLIRVAESVITKDEDIVGVPIFVKEDEQYQLQVAYYDKRKDGELYDFSDSRTIRRQSDHKVVHLTSISHFRLARSKDGINFHIEDRSFLVAENQYETWGIEDPRITKIDNSYYITYSAVSEYGVATAMIKTNDFKNYERLGIIFVPENKDVSIFPEKINGYYYAYHRPVPKEIGNANIWVSKSKDLINWSHHEHLLSVSENGWENGRIGGGGPSVKTENGWLHIYHAADKNDCYCLGAILTDIDDPGHIIAKTQYPIMVPEASYEKVGFFGNVVFTCGILLEEDLVKIYYGASDEVIGFAEVLLKDIYDVLEKYE
jgi:predicted GH43/DUF377 family glycosyl hydrolase